MRDQDSQSTAERDQGYPINSIRVIRIANQQHCVIRVSNQQHTRDQDSQSTALRDQGIQSTAYA
jgi:hypothetical protein